MEDQLAAGSGGIEPLGERAEPDAALAKRSHRLDQMAYRPAQPVELPHHQGVAGAEVVEQLVQLGALAQRTRRGVGEDPRAAGAGQRVALQLRSWSAVETRAYPIRLVTPVVSQKPPLTALLRHPGFGHGFCDRITTRQLTAVIHSVGVP